MKSFHEGFCLYYNILIDLIKTNTIHILQRITNLKSFLNTRNVYILSIHYNNLYSRFSKYFK